MTRFGVMKHLKQLEEAGLVVTRRQGREKLHFLNPVPIRLVHDRWVSKYAEPWAAGLSDLKQRLEQPMEKVFEIYIKTTPERLWEAITDPEIRAKYNFGAAVHSDWKVGSRLEMAAPNAGFVLGEGEVLEVDPPRRLVHTMVAFFSEEAKAEGTTRVTWDIEPVGDSCRLTRHARPDARRRERPDLRRLADDPLGPQDLARDRRAAHDSGITDVRLGLTPLTVRLGLTRDRSARGSELRRRPLENSNTSCDRELMPSLRYTRARWVSTVRVLRNRLLAASRFEAPSAIIAAT